MMTRQTPLEAARAAAWLAERKLKRLRIVAWMIVLGLVASSLRLFG